MVKAVLLDSPERDLAAAREAVFGWMAARKAGVPLLVEGDPAWREDLAWLGLDLDEGSQPAPVLRVRDGDRLAPEGPVLRLAPLRGAEGWTLADFRRRGDLGETLLATLGRLGWPDAEARRHLCRIELLLQYRPEELDPTPVEFDLEDLEEVQLHFMEELTPAELVERSLPFWREQGLLAGDPDGDLRRDLEALALLYGPELQRLPDFPRAAAFRVQDPPPLADERLRGLATALEAVEPWDSDALFEALADTDPDTWELAERAVTGTAPTPGLPEVMALAGREATLRRLRA